MIDIIILKVNKIYRNLVDRDEDISADKIKNAFLGVTQKKKTLLDAFRIHNEMIKSRIGIDFSKSTFTRYQTTYNHIVQFLKVSYMQDDIVLDQLKYSFVTDLEHYLKVTRKCNHNSTLKYIRNCRKIINTAIKNDWLANDPFKAYQVKLKETKRTFLTKDELLKLEQKSFNTERLEQVRDVFIFCCYTGLAHVDIEKLSPNEIIKENDGEFWVNIDRTKTGTPSHVPLLLKALELIEKYKNHPVAVSKQRVLPVITNQRMNGYLKELATLCEISKRLTFHAARHTFATTVTLSNGIPLETVSAMLGHKNFKTTQIYAKVVREKVSLDMMRLRKTLQIPIRSNEQQS